MSNRGPSIQMVDNETKQTLRRIAIEEAAFIMGRKDRRGGQASRTESEEMSPPPEFTSPGHREIRLSHFVVRALINQKEVEFKPGNPERVNILQIDAYNVHVSPGLVRRMAEIVPVVMGAEFRLDPSHQDFRHDYIESQRSFCIQVTGASHDPDVTRKLMRVGAMINGLIQQDGCWMQRG